MKYISLILVVMVLSSFHPQQQKKRIVFFGDSITEQGAKPGGYIRVVDSLMALNGMNRNYETLGAGVSGNKIYDLYLRMDDDVLAKNPSVVVIWVGVNDVWHKRSFGTGTDADKFERFYNAIIKKLKDRNISVILCTPATIGEKNDETNELDGDLNKYSAIIRNIARNNNCALVDLRQAFADYLHTHNPDNKDRGILTTDGVHLNALGNQFVAQKMMEALKNQP